MSSDIEIKVIGEIKENSIMVIRDNIEENMDLKFEMLSVKANELPKGAIIIISNEEPLLFDEKEMNNRGWFKKGTMN